MHLKYVSVYVAAVLGASCSRSPQTVQADPPKAVTVAVARVKPAGLVKQLVLSAEFRPFQDIDVHAKVAGYVRKIFVDVGDRVRQGQRLAVLEVPEMQDDLARAEAAKRRSDADLARARDELARAEAAHTAHHLSYTRLAAVLKIKPDLVAQQEIDDAMGRDRVSEAAVSSARSALAAAEQQVQVAQADIGKVRTMAAYSEITAPFPGVITKRFADTGAMIQAGTASQSQAMPLVRLAQNDLLRLVLPVPETAVPRIHIGAPVEVRVPTLSRKFAGKVARFSGDVQSSTRTMETEVDVPNPGLVLMPGMFAEAALTLDRRDGVLTIPLEAIAGHESEGTVLVADSGRLEERRVKLGLQTATRVEVLSGLKDNEMVLVGSRNQYKPGQAAEPKVVDLDAPEEVK